VYGLPDDFDGSAFVGRELVSVSFTVNTMHLEFDDDVSITLESRFVLHRDGRREEHTVPTKASGLMALVGHTVRLVDASPDGTLRLQFEGGGALTCLDDSKEYESYHLHLRGREIIV
jgi:hypothetical protein